MNQKVTIKGTKSGIILVLDDKYPFELLQKEIADKFKEAAAFFGKSSMGLVIRGRDLDDEQETRVVEIIEENSELTISCIINEESEIDQFMAEAILRRTLQNPEAEKREEAPEFTQVDPSNARIIKGNLRSGQDISCKESVIVLGDVKPGASVTSYGSIFILGELRGNAFAGADGDRDSVVMALKLNPLQVRIADAIAISPDAEKGPKLKLRRKKLMNSVDEPEVAYIENGHIIKTGYGHQFLRSFYRI